MRFVYDPHGAIVAEESGTGVIGKEFVYGVNRVPDYMIYGGVNYKIISDYQGTVKMVVNSATGAVSELISYDVLGNVLSDSNAWLQPFGFAGGVYDQISQYVHFGARWYDASTGRWTSKDPIRFSGGDTNLYGYVLNDPVNFVDPQGTSKWGLIWTALCAAYDASSWYQSAQQIQQYQTQLNGIQNQLKGLDPVNDAQKICDLTAEATDLAQKVASGQTFGSAIGTGIGAVCAGLSQL